jgi:hypothetical protein
VGTHQCCASEATCVKVSVGKRQELADCKGLLIFLCICSSRKVIVRILEVAMGTRIRIRPAHLTKGKQNSRVDLRDGINPGHIPRIEQPEPAWILQRRDPGHERPE